MNNPPQTTRSEQKIETQSLILKTAKKAFLQKGYTETTIRDIAEQAGIATGTVFSHFPSKPSLLAATLINDIERVLGQAYQSTPTDGTLIEVLAHPFRCIFEHFGQIRDLARVWVTETMFLECPWGEKVDELSEHSRVLIRQYLLGAQQQGLIVPESDCDLLASGIYSHYVYVLMSGLKKKLDVDQQSDLFVRLLESQLYGHLVDK